MKISDILKNSTDESRYLIYLIQQFNSQITYKYNTNSNFLSDNIISYLSVS